MLRFDHLGVVVSDLAVGRSHFRSVFGVEVWTDEFVDPVNGVHVQFGLDGGGICYELIAPLGLESPVAGALRTGCRILNHVAYLTDHLEASAAELRANRYSPTGNPKPGIAYGGRRIQFFVSPLGFIVELIEAPEHKHRFLPVPLQANAINRGNFNVSKWQCLNSWWVTDQSFAFLSRRLGATSNTGKVDLGKWEFK
jgi:methylmalonyl-CoA/ethylmalonyl-CoA epimerase